MANLRPLAQPRPARFQAVNTQETSAVQMLPHVPLSKRTTLSQQAKNFYTQGLVYPRRSTTIPLHLGQILIDAGSSVNLISEQIVMDMDIPQIPDCTLAIKVANGRVQQLHAFVRIKLVIASVEQILEAYVIPGSTSSYHLLLSRQWLRDVKAIGNYATDEYWITDHQGTTHPLIPTSIAHQQSINIPKVTLSAQAELSDCRLDEATLSDLEQEPEDMGGAIWDEVIKEAEEEDDCDYESDSTDGPSGKGESW